MHYMIYCRAIAGHYHVDSLKVNHVHVWNFLNIIFLVCGNRFREKDIEHWTVNFICEKNNYIREE